MPIKYDAIISGLGPAGSAAAYELASKGLKVLAIDKAKFPRYKTCGGSVSKKVDKILKFDFSDVVEDTTNGAVFSYKSKRYLFVQHDSPIVSMVMRDRFDNLLVNMARKAGADIIDNTKIMGVKDDVKNIAVETDKGYFQARVLIAADGASSSIAREFFDIDSKACSVTIESEVTAPKERLEQIKGRLMIDFGHIPYGYAWIFPKKDCFSVGIAGVHSKLSKGIKEYFAEFVRRQDILKGLEIKNQRGWTIPEFYGNKKRISNKRILLVGDAAHLADPFIGEGIYYAIRSGQIAADAVINGIYDDDFRAYEADIEREIYPELAAAQKLADMVYLHPKAWYSMLESNPFLIKKYYDVVIGKSNYKEFVREIMDNSRFKLLFMAIKGWLKGSLSNCKLKIGN